METEDREFVEEDDDDLLRQIDWNIMWDQYDNNRMFDLEPPLLTEDSPSLENFSNSSPDSITSWIGQIENRLMKDDDDGLTQQQLCNDFLADILVDSPPSASACSGEVSNDEKDSSAALPSEKKEKEKDIDNKNNNNNNNGDNPDDPISKKRKRQLRNRDAAVRSRERKKMYVRDLELKSRYLEGECRRLDRLLQCFIAENQALRLSLHKGNAFGVTSAKQESAVLLLESLLLGSLLWFLGIMCLFTLPTMPQPNLVEVPLETVGKQASEEVAPRGAGSKMFMSLAVQSLVNGRRCKASRTRMKPIAFFLPVMVWEFPLLSVS